jgi:hypothetical protein
MKERSCATKAWLVRGLALSVLVLVAGCGARGNISGTVRYKGKPLPAGLVTFVTEDGKGHPFDSQIQSDGTYSISKVPAGPVLILVKAAEPPKITTRMGPPGGINVGPPAGAVPEGVKPPSYDPKAEAERYVKIPAKYSIAEQSDLKYTVTSGSQTKDIDLD